jgi:hypothetical protein
MLPRVMAYCRKTFRLPGKITQCAATEGYQPRAGTDRIFGEAVLMVISRMGSLNALRQTLKKTLEASVRLFAAVAGHLCQDVCAS